MTTQPEPLHSPDPAETIAEEPGRYSTLDEAVMESFPASDPIAVDADEPIGAPRGE